MAFNPIAGGRSLSSEKAGWGGGGGVGPDPLIQPNIMLETRKVVRSKKMIKKFEK